MNHFERVAIFTLVENIEAQLKGLKTLIAASAAPSPGQHKVTPTLESDSHELSEQDEDKLQEQIEAARNSEIQRMRKTAEAHFQDEWNLAAQAMSSLDG